MSQPQSQNPIITRKLAQIDEFEEIATDLEGFAANASTPERAAELRSQADIARRQVLQLQTEIAILEQGR